MVSTPPPQKKGLESDLTRAKFEYTYPENYRQNQTWNTNSCLSHGMYPNEWT
jgi:hypothetical protein